MLQIELSRRVSTALQAIARSSELIDVLERLEQHQLDVDRQIAAIAEGGSKLGESANTVHSLLATLPRVTRSFNSRSIFKSVERMHESLIAAFVNDAPQGERLRIALESLDEFANEYDRYITHQSGPNAWRLLQAARRLRERGLAFSSILGYLEESFSDAPSQTENESTLTISLLSVENVGEFAEKLTALHELYRELCALMSVSEAEYPLRIGKIESGSLWAKLFGHSRVLGVIIDFIESAVKYLHRTYTTEGKIGTIPSKVESLDAVLAFSRRLQEQGADVSAIHEELGKAGYCLAKELNTLLNDQPVVQVNGRIHSVNEEFRREWIESARVPRLRLEPIIVDESEPKRLPPPEES